MLAHLQCSLIPPMVHGSQWADELAAGGAAGGGGMGGAGGGYQSGYQSSYQGGGSQGGGAGGYKPGFASYGAGGAGGPPMTLQQAADGGALRDRSNDVCYKVGAVGWCAKMWVLGGAQRRGVGGCGRALLQSGRAAEQARCSPIKPASYSSPGPCPELQCNQPGHWSRDCPNTGGGGAGGTGGYGGGAGAGAYGGGGSGGGFGGGGGGGAKGGGDCYKCGQPGHCESGGRRPWLAAGRLRLGLRAAAQSWCSCATLLHSATKQ